jgi:hypothetical protein
MQINDFKVGSEYLCGYKRWRCTDIGTRVVVAICLDDHDDPSWHNGPPFAIPETVFDEFDVKGFTPITLG